MVQQRYSQIIKFAQHIIKYKLRCSSHTILSQFPLTIFHAYHKQYSTHLTSASISMLGLPSTTSVKLRPAGQQYTRARATYPRLTFNTARKATYPQGTNTQVIEPHSLDLPLTSPVKPHTRRAPIHKC
jgi:hypothetical protein